MLIRRQVWLAALMLAIALGVSAARAASPASAAAAPSDSLEDTPLRLPAAAAGDSTAPLATDPANGLASGATRVGLALVGVLGLIFVLRWMGQRALAPGGARCGRSAVRVLSRTVLAPRQQVLLLHVGRRIVVVGDCGGRMSTLCEIAEPDEVASLVGAADGAGQLPSESAKALFGSVFRRAKEPFSETIQPSGDDVLAVSRNFDDVDEQDAAQVGGLLEKVRMMRTQFKQG